MERPLSADAPDALFPEFSPTSTEEWEAKIHEDLRGSDYEKVLVWDSIEGVRLQPYYRRDDLAEVEHRDLLPLADDDKTPANAWRIRQDISNPDLTEARKHALTALDRGATDIGFDVRLKDGRLHGVPIQTQDDLNTLLEDVSLDETAIHFSAGAASVPLFALLLNTADRQGVDPAELRGSIDFDPAEALLSGDLQSGDAAYDLAARLAARATEMGSFSTLAADMRPYHAGGASTVQEVAFTLATLSELMAQATERGLSADAVRRALHFIVPVGTSFFVEIGKLRALRLLIPQVLSAYDADPDVPFIQATTARCAQTVYDPHVNMLRATTAATTAVVGGCDGLTVRPFDAEFEAPDTFAYRIARNTQLILKHESHFDVVADPAAGSYYVEQLTDQVAEKAWALFQTVEERGGLLQSLGEGWIQEQIGETQAARNEQIQQRKRVLVGTNHYPNLDETKRDEATTRPTGTPLQQTRASVDLLDSEAPLTAMRRALDEVATLGDVMKALRTGETKIEPLPIHRAAEPFDNLRLRTEEYAAEHDGAPTVFLIPVGHPSWRSARANFARNFFGVAGFDIVENLRFESAEDGAQAALDADADIIVICSSDAEYADLAPTICERVRGAGSDALVVVAGYPSDQIESLESAGVDGFIHKRSPLLETLREYQQHLNIG